jgi:hypothetical protein
MKQREKRFLLFAPSKFSKYDIRVSKSFFDTTSARIRRTKRKGAKPEKSVFALVNSPRTKFVRLAGFVIEQKQIFLVLLYC